MDYNQFKNEWRDAMVFSTVDFDLDETLNELYAEYKDGLKTYGKNYTVKQWCEFFHAECDLDKHPYMLKGKAINTHHGNGLKEMANKFRKNNGLPLIPLITPPSKGGEDE